MLQLYFAPRTRAVRVAWLLEELALPYELVRCAFTPPTDRFFSQPTPTGKLPTLVDGDLVLCESGAIVETILERYGEGRLVPPAGSDDRARYLQWLHYADSTAFPPLGIVVWLTRYRGEGEAHGTEFGIAADDWFGHRRETRSLGFQTEAVNAVVSPTCHQQVALKIFRQAIAFVAHNARRGFAGAGDHR